MFSLVFMGLNIIFRKHANGKLLEGRVVQEMQG